VPVLRRLRKELVNRLLVAGMQASIRGSVETVDRLRSIAQFAVRTCLPIRVRLARNMRLAGVYRKGLVDEYLDRAGDQFAFLMRIFAARWEGSGVAERFRFDESFQYVEQAYGTGRGVLIASPHLCGYPLISRVVTDRIPCTVYTRRSPDPRKHRISEAVAEAAGGEIIFPPEHATRSERLTVALRVLREGKMLYLTPDLIRRPDQGTPVTIFDRTVYFPTGVPIMAMRTRSPVVIVLWEYRDGLYHLHFDEPMDLSGRGDRDARAVAWVRKFAGMMDDWLHEHPGLWWNWLDKRWTWAIRGR